MSAHSGCSVAKCSQVTKFRICANKAPICWSQRCATSCSKTWSNCLLNLPHYCQCGSNHFCLVVSKPLSFRISRHRNLDARSSHVSWQIYATAFLTWAATRYLSNRDLCRGKTCLRVLLLPFPASISWHPMWWLYKQSDHLCGETIFFSEFGIENLFQLWYSIFKYLADLIEGERKQESASSTVGLLILWFGEV